MSATFPTDTEIDVMVLAVRQLNQLHHHLDVQGAAVSCTDCGAVWLCDMYNDKLRLTETKEGNGSCEAEVLRTISTAGLYSELGRRRLGRRKTVTRAGGRPRAYSVVREHGYLKVKHLKHGTIATFSIDCQGKPQNIRFLEERFQKANGIRQPAMDAVKDYIEKGGR